MSSDRDHIKNIAYINESGEVLKLRPVSFVVKGGTKTQFGFVAQEIEDTALGNIVFKDGRGVRSVAFNQIIPLLLHQIQELHERIAALEQR